MRVTIGQINTTNGDYEANTAGNPFNGGSMNVPVCTPCAGDGAETPTLQRRGALEAAPPTTSSTVATQALTSVMSTWFRLRS